LVSSRFCSEIISNVTVTVKLSAPYCPRVTLGKFIRIAVETSSVALCLAPHLQPRRVRISLYSEQTQVHIRTSEATSLLRLKEKIGVALGPRSCKAPPKLQRLFFANEELQEDTKTLRQCGIQDKAVLKLVLCHSLASDERRRKGYLQHRFPGLLRKDLDSEPLALDMCAEDPKKPEDCTAQWRQQGPWTAGGHLMHKPTPRSRPQRAATAPPPPKVQRAASAPEPEKAPTRPPFGSRRSSAPGGGRRRVSSLEFQ